MSMMMKLINAAAGQSVGDEIYFVNMTTNTLRLAKIDFDAGTLTYGPNNQGTYGDPDTGGNNAQPDTFGHYSYSSNSNGSSIVGDDGYLYSIARTDLDNQYPDAKGGTAIIMRWNLRTLTPDPGFFYNVLYRNDSSAIQHPQTAFYHAPSKTITVIGWVELPGTHAVAHTFKVDPWPSTAIDAMGSGRYHSTLNPNGRHMGTFLRPESNQGQTYALSNSATNSYERFQVFSNGKDQIGVTTEYGSIQSSSNPMSFKRAYTHPSGLNYNVSYSPEVYNVGSGNFGFEGTSPENPFLEMTGTPIPGYGYQSGKSWKRHNNNGSTNHGLVNVWYRPGRDNAGIHKTPGVYYIQNADGGFYTLTEGSTKPESYDDLGDPSSYSRNYKYTLLDNGLLVRPYSSGQNPSNGYTEHGIKIADIDNRVRGVVPGGYTVHGDYYDQSFQHTPSDPQSEYIPLSKNPNNKYFEKIVQTKSGRIFGVLYYETASELPPNGGTRVIEIFISDPDPNNFGRRSVSYGDSKIFTTNMAASGSQAQTLVGNMPTAKISTANATAAVKTRFSDVGTAFIQDTPTDAIYIRENTHLYAINPNTRSNITSYDFANQGISGLTNATNIDPSTDSTGHARPSWGSEQGRSPTGRFVEGEHATSDFESSSNSGMGDVEGNTTYDLIYGDDTRLYMAIKMDVEHYPTSSYGGQYGYQDIEGTHCLVRFHTGKDGTTIVCGERGPHPNEYDNLRYHPNGTNAAASTYANRLAYGQREYYYFGLLNNHNMTSMNNHGPRGGDLQGGLGGMFSGINLMYDNKRNNVWVVGRRDHLNCNNPDGRVNYSKMIAVPVGTIGPDLYNPKYQGWPGTQGYVNNEPVLANLNIQGPVYGQIGWIGSSQASEQFNDDGGLSNSGRRWMNSANYANSDTPNGFEMRGVISGQAINVTINGRTDSYNDEHDPTTKNKGSQVYFSGMTNDPRPYNTGSQTYPPSINRAGTAHVSPLGENRIGAVPFKFHSNGVNNELRHEPGYGYSNRNHNPAQNTTLTTQNQHLYHARIKLKTNQTTSVTADNNEEGIRCVWYYKGAFHGVTTYNEGTYVYMPEPEHGYNNDINGSGQGNTASPNDNINTITHYVSQCESGQNSYNSVIGGQNTKIGTAEGCKNADWAACLAPGGILCIPKQDSGYNNAGFLTINLGTRQIINTNGNPPPLLGGEPFVAPSSLNPNGRQIKQMVVTSTGKIWAILDYENPSASTLQFRILQVVFNSNHTSVTWSGGLYTSQASNSNSGHVKFYRTVCGNMPQSKMEWDAV